MPQKTAAEIAYEAQKRATELYTGVSPYTLKYHCQLNINNTVINAFYEDTLRSATRSVRHGKISSGNSCGAGT